MRDSYRKVMELDAVASRFEELLLAGESPRIETFLDSNPELEKPELLRELLSIELEILRQSGTTPQVDQYIERFGKYRADVDTCFREGDTVEANDEVTLMPGPASFQLSDKLPDIPGFELRQKVGEGGMGVVYLADQLSPYRVVALKMIRLVSFAGERERKRFRAETDAVAKLDHPNIVPLLEVGEFEGLPYLTMPFVDGKTLTERIGESTMASRDAAEMLCQLAEGVQHAHDTGLVHRDIKPANVLLTKTGSPRLTDFGLASEIDAKSQLTGTGELLGTPTFMAPEQAAGKNTDVSIPADIYALGAVLYFALTGRPPHQGTSPLDTINRVLNDDILPPRSIDPKIERDLETICLKCLRREQHSRYSSATDLLADLRSYLTGNAIAARPEGPVRKTLRWCRRSPWRAAAVLMAVVSVVGILGGIAGYAEYRRVAAKNILQAKMNEQAFADRERAELLTALEQQMLFERTEKHLDSGDTVAAQTTLNRISAVTVQRKLIQKELNNPRRQFIQKERLLCGSWPILSASWSPDQKHLLTGDHGGQLRTTDLDSGDSKSLTSGYLDPKTGMVRHWVSNQRLKPEELIKGDLYVAVHWTEPTTAYAATLKGRIIRFDPTAKEPELETIVDLETDVFCLGVSSDGHLMAGTADGHLERVNPTDGTRTKLNISENAVSVVRFSKAHKHWIAGTDDGQVIVVNDDTTEVVTRTKFPNRIWDIGVSTGGLLAIALRQASPAILVFADGKLEEQQRLLLPNDSAPDMHAIQFTAENSICASGPANRLVTWRNGQLHGLWTSTTSDSRLPGSLQAKLPLPMQRHVAAVNEERDREFGLAEHTGQYRRLSLEAPKEPDWIIKPPNVQLGPMPDVAFDRTDGYLWSLSSEGILKVTDTRKAEVLDTIEAHVPQELKHIAPGTLPNETARRSEVRVSKELVATVARSNEIKFWKLDQGRIAPADLSPISHTEPLLSVDISDSSGLIAAVDSRAHILLWDLQTGRKLAEEIIPASEESTCPNYGAIRFNADGTLLVATGPQQDTRVFDTKRKITTNDYFGVSGSGALELEWSLDCDLIIAQEDTLHRLYYTDERRERLMGKTSSLREVVGQDRKLLRLVDTDFVKGSGFVTLYSNAAFAFHSSKHFLETGAWRLPDSTDCHSFSVSDSIDQLAVAHANGSLTLLRLDEQSSATDTTTTESISVQLASMYAVKAPRIYPKWAIDNSGKPYGVFLKYNGQMQEGGQLNYFEATGRNWTVEPLEIEPNDRWVVFGGGSSTLWKKGSRTEIMYRRRRPDIAQYAFETILAERESAAAQWNFERVIKSANAGQQLVAHRDDTGKIVSIAHHTPAGYHTLVSKRGDQEEHGWPIVMQRHHEYMLGHVPVGNNIHTLLRGKRFARGSEEVPRYAVWNGDADFQEQRLPKGVCDARLLELPDGRPLIKVIWFDHRRKCSWFVRDENEFQKYCPDFGYPGEQFIVLPNGKVAASTSLQSWPLRLRTDSKTYEFRIANAHNGSDTFRKMKIDKSGAVHVLEVSRSEENNTIRYGKVEVDW